METEVPTRDDSFLTDFATLYSHMWYRDFPLHPSVRDKAERADWTIHIGITVRSIADLMGLFTHFESGQRTDAILRGNRNEAMAALEWEWNNLPDGDELLRIEIAKAGKKAFAFQLSHYGVNRMALFPDLDGLSSHINWSFLNLDYSGDPRA